MQSWRSASIAIGTSKINGRGNIAVQDIKKDQLLAVRSGHIVPIATALDLMGSMGYVFLQISADLALSPIHHDEISKICCFWNHSCEANVGLRGDICFVVMRDIEKGEEICIDYATIAAHPLKIDCTCGSRRCRNKITGEDWKLARVQEQYRGYFTCYVQSCINRLSRA